MPVFNNILAGASGSAGGAAAGDFKIERSLRFDANATSYLSREFAQGNQKKWTWSAWVKRSKLVDNNYLALFTAPVGGQGNDGIFFRNNALSLSFGYAGSGIECYTSSVFNDPSAWYHICVSVNTDETTAADRIRVWVNNKLQTLNQYPGPGATAGIGAATKHHLGVWRRGSSTNYAFDGYMADVNYLDGIAITSPEGVFGNYSSTTGAWDPIRYTGSHTVTGGTSGTLPNYNNNTSLPTYSDQDNNSGTPSVYQMENAFDGNSSTYANMTYNNGKWTRANFAQPITNVTRIDIGWDGEGDVGYNGSVVNSSVGYNGSRQSLTLYNNSGSPITLNNIHMVSQAGNGVCRLYDVTITTTTQSATELTFSSVPDGPNGFHLDFSSTTQFTHPNKYVTQSGSATPPSNASTLTYNTGNYFGGNQGVTYDAGSVRRFYVQPGSADPTVKTSNDGTTWTTVFDGSVGWNDPVEVNCRYVYMSSSGNGFGPYFRQPAFVADSSGNNNHFVDGNIFEVKTPATTAHRYWRVVIYGYTSHWPRMSSLELYEADGTQRTHTNFTSDNCNDQGEIPDEGEVFDADYTNNYNFTNVGVYSTYNGGTRTGRADVYYSDDSIRWTYSFTSVVSNNASCGIQVGSVAETDVFLDSPTNYDDGTNIGGNYATLNPLNKATNSILSNGNLDLSCTANNEDRLVFSTIGMSSGKWYCEYSMGGAAATHGLSGPALTQGRYVGQASADQWGYYNGNGKLYNNGSNSNYGATYSAGDIIGIAFDADNGTLKFYKNGSDQGTAATGLTSGPYFFAFGESAYNGSINFGQRPFAHPLSGYKALCTQNFDDPPFDDPSDVFDVNLYNGTSVTQNITNLNFQPDLLWIKSTSNPNTGSYHHLIDSVRGEVDGFFRTIHSNTDEAENTYPGVSRGGVTSLNNDGFTLEAGSSDYFLNENNHEYVRWAWNAGTVSNPVGDIWQGGAGKYFGIKFPTASGGTISYGQSSGSNTVEVWTSPDNNNWTQQESSQNLSAGHTYTTSNQFVLVKNTANATMSDWYVAAPDGSDGHYSGSNHGPTTGGGESWNGPGYTDYDFRRTGGVVNTDGSQPSIVRASPANGFSIVQWNNPSGNITVGHGLNKPPTVIWTKGLGTYEWMNYHKNLGNGYRYPFDTTTNKTGTSVWQSSDPTSSIFNFADSTEAKWIAYCFTPTEGVFASGEYQGGSSPFVYCGFSPAFVMLKNVDINGEEMVMYDVARDPNNVAYQTLYTNSSSQNYNGLDANYPRHIDILSNGFRANTGNPVNQSGKHIWMAWAENPLKYARAR